MTRQSRRDFMVTVIGGGAAIAMPAAFAASQPAFPSHNVRIIVPFAPGGPTDVAARLLAQRLAADWPQPPIVENRPGASGIVGAAAVAKAPADGYTLLFATIHHVVAPSLFPELPYDFEAAFEPVSMVLSMPVFICVNAGLPVHSLAELIEYAKANPKKVSYGSSGNGGATHLAGELFNIKTGLQLLHVPYRGSNPAMMDLLGGQIDVMFADSASAIPQMKAGRVRALAVGSGARSPLYPEVPTVMEAGVADYVIETWGGIVAPAGTPQAVVERINADIGRALADPALQRQYAELGAEARASSAQQYAQRIREESAQWAEVIRTAGITSG